MTVHCKQLHRRKASTKLISKLIKSNAQDVQVTPCSTIAPPKSHQSVPISANLIQCCDRRSDIFTRLTSPALGMLPSSTTSQLSTTSDARSRNAQHRHETRALSQTDSSRDIGRWPEAAGACVQHTASTHLKGLCFCTQKVRRELQVSEESGR